MGESAIDFILGVILGVGVTMFVCGIVVSSGSARNIKQCESVGITEISSTIIKCSIAEGE